MRNPFSRKPKQVPENLLGVNLDELNPRMDRWIADHPEATDDDKKIEVSVAITELGAEERRRGAQEEGHWVVFRMDDDGFLIGPDDQYVIRSGLREGKTFEQLRRERPSVAVFKSLVDDDHATRQQAIATLVSAAYQDPEDPRSFAILGRASDVQYGQEELNKDMESFPDFDIAYVRAAYPTARSEDHAHADTSPLLEGLTRCKVKSRLLARLSSYYTWKGEWLKALDLGAAAVLIGFPSEGPGDMVQALALLEEAFLRAELPFEAALASRVSHYLLGPDEAAAVERAAIALASQSADDVRYAADTVREKLLQTLQEQPSP